MGYSYQTERPWLFTAPGQRLITFVRLKTKSLIRMHGLAFAEDVWDEESWDRRLVMTCLDRMVELGEIEDSSDRDSMDCYRTFIAPKDQAKDLLSMLSIIAEFRDKTIA